MISLKKSNELLAYNSIHLIQTQKIVKIVWNQKSKKSKNKLERRK